MTKRDMIWTLVTLLGVLQYVACSGTEVNRVSGPAPVEQVETVTLNKNSAVGSITKNGNFITFTIEGGQRGNNFMAQLWNKFTDGTSRDGAPVFEQRGLGNGTLVVDASQWACYDLQADLGGLDGGLLVSKQFAAWGPCPEPTPKPRPTPPPDCEGEECEPECEVGVSTVQPNPCPTPTPSPSPTPSPEPSPTPTPEPSPTPPPPPPSGACYYRVSCGGQVADTKGGTSCTDQNQQLICEHTIGGNPAAFGVWQNFGEAALLNHCRYTVPGLVNNNFQLNPGQSDKACLSKNDD